MTPREKVLAVFPDAKLRADAEVGGWRIDVGGVPLARGTWSVQAWSRAAAVLSDVIDCEALAEYRRARAATPVFMGWDYSLQFDRFAVTTTRPPFAIIRGGRS